MGSPLAKHVPVDNIKLKVDNPLAKNVPVGNTTTKRNAQLAKHVPVVHTKSKVGSPFAKHVPVVLTALLAPQVVNILLLPVLSEPMPVVQQPFVIHAVLENTMIKQVKYLH